MMDNTVESLAFIIAKLAVKNGRITLLNYFTRSANYKANLPHNRVPNTPPKGFA
jgi:hypothetical protein